MKRDIAGDVKRVVRKQLDVDEGRISPAASLVDDLGADSLALVQLTLALEDEFGIDINDQDAERIRTVQDAIQFVEQRATAARAAGPLRLVKQGAP